MPNFKELEKGVLCHVLIGNYKSLGTPKIILHEADCMELGSYSYGHKRHWVFPLPYHAKSKKKSRSSKKNGKKGGRKATK